MKKAKKIATIHNGQSFIEREIYLDEENIKYVKICGTFIAINILEEYYKYKVDIWF